MTLAPRLFDRRYDQLVELGRAQIPALAPTWTDHNAHDPGITLLELLAHVAEAQIYSLGRMRRDERLAYAALLGVLPGGRRPARGLLWRDRADLASPAATEFGSRIIEKESSVHVVGQRDLELHTERKVLWVPGDLTRLWARSADGTVRDLTALNERGTMFLPFGEEAGPRDVLTFDFTTREGRPFLPPDEDLDGAAWILGVRGEDEAAREGDESPAPCCHHVSLDVSVVVDGASHRVPVLEDSTLGLLRTGILVLDVAELPPTTKSFVLEMRAPRGFVRPPRWRRIEPNVLPITSRRCVENEKHVARGEPDFELDLDEPGLCFASGEGAVRVEVSEDFERLPWKRCERLADEGPDARVFELDPVRGRLRFGNGINGRKPMPNGEIFVSYAVSRGSDANVAARRLWKVAGFEGTFGTNLDPVTGARGRAQDLELRREARTRVRATAALVSADDIVRGARELPLLGVARAWVVPPSGGVPANGTVTLVVLRARPSGVEPHRAPETARWLAAVRRALSSRMPLGTHLRVISPRYVDVAVDVQLDIEPGKNPEDVAVDARRTLAERLAVVPRDASVNVRGPGVPLARSEVAAWLRSVAGVTRVRELKILREAQVVDGPIRIPRHGLVRLDDGATKIAAKRGPR